MAFFAISGDSDDSFEVLQCHINLWCLGGIFGHNNFVWDVGLRLKGTTDNPVSKIQLALPFGTADFPVEDLFERLIHPLTAELVFGNPVKIDGNEITYDSQPVVLGRVAGARRIADKCGATFSFWEIEIAPMLLQGKELYIRVRFRIAGRGNTWVWRRSLGRKNGALIDLRVSDVREAVALGAWGALKDRIVPIHKLNLLVIAPDFLQLRAESPPLRYMRLLESQAWENYLGQSPNFSARRRLIIYHWRNEKPVDITTPFLAFLDLSRDYGFVRPTNHVRAAILIVLLAALAQTYGASSAHDLWIWARQLTRANKVASILGSAGIAAFLLGFYKNWPIIHGIASACKAGFLAAESLFLKAKRR